jgi:acid phosphatase type 7
MKTVISVLFFGLALILQAFHSAAIAHDGPDPRCSWLMNPVYRNGGILKSQAGPNLRVDSEPRVEKVGRLNCFRMRGEESILFAEPSWDRILEILPENALTVSAWVSLDETIPFGGIISAFQDNGNAETGWVLGYNEKHFTFAL